MTKESKEISIKEFIELISQTEIIGAKEWVVKFISPIPNGDSYGRALLTAPAVECIAAGISAQICQQIRQLYYGEGKPYADVSGRGHAFLREIHQKATELGLVVGLENIDFFSEPRVPMSM